MSPERKGLFDARWAAALKGEKARFTRDMCVTCFADPSSYVDHDEAERLGTEAVEEMIAAAKEMAELDYQLREFDAKPRDHNETQATEAMVELTKLVRRRVEAP